MLAVKNHIIVKVWTSQKEEIVINGNLFKTGINYNENFREKNPVVAYVKDGIGEIKSGSWIVCNYNYFDWSSPYCMFDDIYTIPVNEEIFAIINEDGTLKPINGNILVERVTIESVLELPEELKKPHINRGIVASGFGNYKKGDFIFWLPYSDYEIVYNWNGIEKRALKIHHSEIVGRIKK